MRLARLTDAPKLSRRTDRLTTTTARFEATEPCTWPAIAPAATYLGLPVLEDRPDESTPLEAMYGRQLRVDPCLWGPEHLADEPAHWRWPLHPVDRLSVRRRQLVALRNRLRDGASR